MSLLPLSPEVNRLRRIAKACAAGELTRSEYRAARRQVIEQFLTHRIGEDTIPRVLEDITQRRPQPVASEPVVTPNKRWWMRMFVGVLLAVAVALPWWVQAAEQIPVLSERDPNPATSQRLMVDEVHWVVAENLSGIDQQQVAQLLNDALADVKKRNTPSDHGFSGEELQEVGRFLNALGVHDPRTRLSGRDLQDLVALVAQQKDRRGVSVVQLEQIAQRLQEHLRAQGYPLATAYVPAQPVNDGQVRLAVEVGVLSAITVAQGRDNGVTERFSDLLGKPVQSAEVATKVNLLNGSGANEDGVRTSVSFVPGQAVGTTEMILRLEQPARFTGAVQLDNHGVEDLGQERLALSGTWRNPRGVGDQLQATAFTSLDDADQQYLALRYSTPFWRGRYQASSRLAYGDVAFDRVGIDGRGLLWDAEVTDTRLYTRKHRRQLSYGVGVHDLDWQVLLDQRSVFAHAGIRGHRLWDQQQIAVEGGVNLLVGNVDEQLPGQSATFWRLRSDWRTWTPVQLPGVELPTKLVWRGQWQISNDQLPPTLRLSGAGPQRNRGFGEGELLLDQGIASAIELRLDSSLGQWWAFIDAVYGETHGDADRWFQLTSVGLGWQADLWRRDRQRLRSQITIGVPISHDGSGGFEDDGTQVFWSLRYSR